MARHLLTLRVNASLADISFSPERSTLLLLTLENRLLSVEASEAGHAAPSVRNEWIAPEGRVIVAAGWLEGRVAVVSLGGGELQLSHGVPGLEGGASSNAQVMLEGNGPHFAELVSPRFDPYVRWWQEINPIEQCLVAVSLLRDAREHLFAIAIWQEGGQYLSRLTLVAERVSGFSGWDERGSAAFTGTVAGVRGVFALDRRSTAPIPLQHLVGDASFRTFFAWRGTPDRRLLSAIEQAPNTWLLSAPGAPSAVMLDAGEEAVGLAAPLGDASLVVLGPDRCDLSLIRAGSRTHHFRAVAAITRVAVHPTLPLLAYVAAGEVTLLALDQV